MKEANYTAVANLGNRKAKENLDSFDELQKFMDKMKKRKAISVQVTKIDGSKKQTIGYDWDGGKWVIKKKGSVQRESKKMTESIRTNIRVGKNNITFIASFRNGKLDLTPLSANDTMYLKDFIYTLPDGRRDFAKMLEKELNRRTKLNFSFDYGYPGAGYVFDLDGKSIEKLL